MHQFCQQLLQMLNVTFRNLHGSGHAQKGSHALSSTLDNDAGSVIY